MQKTKKNTSSAASAGQIAQANGIEIWHETFGNKENPALVLISGALGQGILWPTEFCEKLCNAGFYVIRYDHRDTGLSTCFNFEKNPYNLLDMAKDVIGLLDFLKIEKAHICGLSMGGVIAELLAVHFEKRISSLTLIATSCDFRPSSRLYKDEYPGEKSLLSEPKEIYLNWRRAYLQSPPQTEDEKIEERVGRWSILNGSKIPFEEDLYREIFREFFSRAKHPECANNHFRANENSFEMIQSTPCQVKVPTVIFHGTEDPIFPQDHGKALSEKISGAKYILVNGLGHVPNKHVYSLFIEEIKRNAQAKKLNFYCLETSQGKIAIWDSKPEANATDPTVIFLHGHCTNKTFFSAQMNATRLGAYRKICLDLPGYGKSDPPKEPEKVYSFPGFAHIVKEVLTRLDLQNVVVVGWSLGGHIAMELLTCDSQIKGILITGAPPIEISEAGLGRGFRIANPEILACFGKGNLSEKEAELLATISGYDYSKEKRFIVDAILETDEGAKTIYPQSILKGIGQNEREIVGTSPLPIAVVAGEKDTGINNEYICEVKFLNLWKGKVHIIKDAGHAVHMERPEEFNLILHEFLQDVL